MANIDLASRKCANLLVSTSYALNKSNTKRALVGLDYNGGYYRAVIKLCSTGSPLKYVTLDTHAWELIVDQMEAMTAYLQNSFTFYQNFGNPTRLFLPTHDINFTMAYGARAICIEERPNVVVGGNGKLMKAAEKEEEEEAAAATAEPSCKKKKFDNPPSIVMQLATFEGLKEVRECIDAQVKRVEEYAGFVNRCLDSILEFLKNKLNEEGTEKAKSILKDSAAFKQYYNINNFEIVTEVKKNMGYAPFSEETLNIILLELRAFCLPMLAKDLYDFMFAP